MGMYTELVMGVEIFPDEKVLQKLEYMLDNDNPDVEIKHPLFSDNTRWNYMLMCDSYYFDGQTDSKLIHDSVCKTHYLNVRCNLKNYSNEIDLFLDWLCPYIKTEGFLGYMRYEEWKIPVLIYKEDGEIVYKDVTIKDRNGYKWR